MGLSVRGVTRFGSSRPRKALADIVVALSGIHGTREFWLPNLDDQTRTQLSHLRNLDHTQVLAISIDDADCNSLQMLTRGEHRMT